MKDTLGDRIKQYETQTTSDKLINRLPIVCRIDGRSFHTFTKGLKRPYDERLSNLMFETSFFLCKETNANCVYTQSDEISLVWYSEDIKSQNLFDGKVFKLTSILASLATGFFNKNLSKFLPEKSHLMPTFDCRVFNLPNSVEVGNYFYWRELDATKNSISMAAQHYYSHKELNGKNGSEKQEMLFQKGVNWNDYPSFFKRGTYIQRKRILTKFTTEELSKLPPKHKARQNPDLMIERWTIDKLDLPPLMTIKNREEVILFGAEPSDVRSLGYTIEDMLEAFYAKGDKVDMTEFKFWVDSVLPLLKNKEKEIS
jgi:tRNA(His) 5'-end guanylyltransferase